MANKRKYPEVKGYWVYSIQIQSINKYYIGVSQMQCSKRWIKFNYKGSSLEPYLNEWDSMEKTVLVDNLNKEQSYQYEDNIIRALQMNDLCINKQRSGLIKVSDTNAYQKQYYEDNKERINQYYEDNKERINQRAKKYREDNKEKKREYDKQRYERKKLEKQQNQTSLPL